MLIIVDIVFGDNNFSSFLFVEGGVCVFGVVGVFGVSRIGGKSEDGKDGDVLVMGV